jgi:hypothetical protein
VKTDRLIMPDHNVVGEDVACRGGVEPGYALDQPDGRLHCNRCGWVTPESVVTTLSDATGFSYLTWDAMVAAEANGWVAVAIVSSPTKSWPWMTGPYETKAAAQRALDRMRTKFRREAQQYPNHTYRLFVRPLWKDDRG